MKLRHSIVPLPSVGLRGCVQFLYDGRYRGGLLGRLYRAPFWGELEWDQGDLCEIGTKGWMTSDVCQTLQAFECDAMNTFAQKPMSKLLVELCCEVMIAENRKAET